MSNETTPTPNDPAIDAQRLAYQFVLALANPQLTDAQAGFEGLRAVFAVPFDASEQGVAYQTAWNRLNRMIKSL